MLPALPRSTRREMRDLTSRFKAGLLAPLLAVPFEPGEGGTVSSSVTFELDPVAGRVITPMYMEVTGVLVPITAVEQLLAPTSETAAIPEVVKQKYLTGNPLYNLEAETEISRRLGVVPQKIAGVQQVCSVSRLAYIAAVNFLRKRKYAYAVEELHTSTAIHRAILSETILDRFNGVLDPADEANGRVNLDIGTMNLPVGGIGFAAGQGGAATRTVRTTTVPAGETGMYTDFSSAAATPQIKMSSASGTPEVYAIFNGSTTGVNLIDFYKAENHDKMIRLFNQIVDENPLDGEDAVMRFVHGFTMEPGRFPVVAFEKREALGLDIRMPMDNTGIQADAMMSKGMGTMSFTTVVPTSEIGAILVVLASLKPDETVKDQPHPILSKPWGARNHVDDDTKLDPVGVLMRELDSEISTGSETTVAFYTGLHETYRNYQNYGFTRNTNPTTVENKTEIWQVKVPASVTPENVVMPVIDQYPFLDQNAEIVRCRIQAMAAIATPRVFGPTPVEEVDVVAAEGLLT